ncbi:fibronectin type III domain-containing protein [Flavobacterium sp. I3-2]|uniref:fibronectin type III domain-containing protein n=1 Tax=Flavobacterium sp. I3-2 TaxID=2748319 RepID=UPI0015B195F3|nr:fibronectin type III domain-containing protein [Flavobacterium sp. I3-2]
MIKRLHWLYSQLLLGVLLLCGASIHAQQTHLLLDPVGAGGFELGDTFDSNGWTVINETQTNKWVLGAVPQWFAGNRGAYISNNATTNANAYTISSVSIVHFYRDITFPIGSENVTISLDVSMAGESSWDNVMVYLADVNVVPSSVGPTGQSITGFVADVSTIASQIPGATPNSTALAPTWPNYTNGTTGFYLDAVVGLQSGSTSPQTQTNLNINLTPEQINYVAGNTKRLIITWKNDSGGGAQAPGAVDNIKVEAFVPACYTVGNLVSSNVTNNSFVASWNPDLTSLGYTYEVRTSGVPESGAQGLITSGTLASNVATINVDNLSGNQIYNVYIKKNCSATLGFSNWKQLNVTTLCGVSGYFLENFDSTPTNGSSTNPVVPTCWSAIDSGAGYVYVTTGSNYQSSRGLAMTNSTDTSGDYVLVSPKTENLGNGAGRIRFRAKTTSTSTNPSTTLKVVTLENQTNLTGMQQLQEITLTDAYQEFTVNLPAGTNDYFAFKHGLNATSRIIYIDDVYFEPIPPCSSPVSITVDNVSVNSITISYPLPSGIPTNTQFEYEVRTSGLPGSGSTGLASTGFVSTANNNFTVTGLNHTTQYMVYLRANCGSGFADSWKEIQATTLCGVYTSINENFDTVPTGSSTNPTRPTCWGYIDAGAGYAYVSTTAQYESVKGYYMYNASDVENDLILVSPETNNLGNGGYRLRFRAKTTSTLGTDLQILTLANQDNTNNASILETINLTTTYEEYTVYLPQGTNDFFGFKHGLNATLRYIYLDNIIYEPIPACPNILDLQFVNSTQTTSTISWSLPTGLESNANLFYEVRTEGLPGSGNTGLATSGNFVAGDLTGTITGLEHSTTFTVYVKTVCTATGFDGWKQVSFFTKCAPYDLINESFSDTATGSSTDQTVPLCWYFIDEGVGSGYVSTTANYSAPNGFYINNSSDLNGNYVLVSPETNNLGNGAYRVRFRAKKQYVNEATTIKFVTLATQNDVSSITEIQTIPLSGDYEEYIVYLPLGTNDYFGFKHQTTSTTSPVYIDNIVYEPIPSCVEVLDFNVNMNLSNSSAILTWANPNLSGLVDNFEIQYGLEDFELGTGTSVSATGSSKIISNLVIGETYEFYIRRICSETDKSSWVGPFTLDFDYCSSIPTSNDGLGITQFVLGDQTFTIPDVMYQNLLDQVVDLDSQLPITSSITFGNNPTYHAHIWIDFNRDGVFDNETERFFSGESLAVVNPTTLDSSFTIDDIYETGVYRMRVGTADSGQATPNPCYSGSWGVTIDIKVNVTFPCLDPTDLEANDLTTASAILNWSAAGTNFDIEYGPQGFQQGTGTIISNVNKPYSLTNLNQATDYSFYVKQVCADGESGWSAVRNFTTLCGTPSPIGNSFQTLVEDDFVSDIVVEGQGLRYYSDVDMTQEILDTAVLTEGYYYITQTIDCESDLPLEVYVALIDRIDEPVVQTRQEFCDNAVLADLVVQGLPNATVNWFADATSTQVLTQGTVLTTGTYYVNQTDGETTSHRVAVNVIVNQTPIDLVSTDVLVCGYANYGSLQVGQLPGVTMKWYTSLTSMTPVSNTQQVVTGTYYVTQSFGICESNRVQIEVSAFEGLATPISATQTFCGSGTVSQLVAQGVAGAQLKWFGSATATVELNPNTQLTSGTYYVEQRNNGCVSARKAVAVRIVSIAAPNVDAFTLCGPSRISNLIIPSQSGVTHKWYNSPSSPTELAQTTPLATGTYFVSRVQYGCESQRTPVQVNIEALPTAPTGQAVQTFIEGSTLSDLVLNQNNVTWYASYSDSQNGVNPLVANMPLANGQIYYAVIIGANGCPSLPFAVRVDVYLSNDQFDKNELKYFPNPVDDVLTISYSDVITQIEVFDLLGKRVQTLQTNENEVKVDLSNLPSGTYIIQLKTDSKQQFVKIIKR